jgi:hypothetical protein
MNCNATRNDITVIDSVIAPVISTVDLLLLLLPYSSVILLSESSITESKEVAYQKYLTEQNNLLAVKVIANQTVVQAQAAARSISLFFSDKMDSEVLIAASLLWVNLIVFHQNIRHPSLALY